MEHNLYTERVEVIAVKAAGYETAAGTHGPGCSHGETAQVLSQTEFADQHLTYFGFICNHFFQAFLTWKGERKEKFLFQWTKRHVFQTPFQITYDKNKRLSCRHGLGWFHPIVGSGKGQRSSSVMQEELTCLGWWWDMNLYLALQEKMP